MKLFNGDALQILSNIQRDSVVLVFADPPYFLSNGGISVASGRQVSVDKGDWDRQPNRDSVKAFHEIWLTQIRNSLKPNGAVVISGTYHSIYVCASVLESLGFKILNEIVWFKPNGAPNLSGNRLAASHETLIWASKTPKSKYTFNYEELKNGNFEGDVIKRPGRQMRSVWWIPTTPAREKTFGSHPTQKPLALMERIITAFTNRGDLVLDPFMGSGTTGVACRALGRSFVGVEQDEAYFALAEARMGIN